MADKFEQMLTSFSVEELEEQLNAYIQQSYEMRRRASLLGDLIKLRKQFAAENDDDSEPAGLQVELLDEERHHAGTTRLTVVESILELMSDGKPWTADQLLAALRSRGEAPRGKTPKNSIQATLSRMTTAGTIKRPSTGVYKIPSETSGGDSGAEADAPETLL